MKKEIDNKLNLVYSEIMKIPNEILEIFNDFFGENNVDMQNFITLDHFKTRLSSTIFEEYLNLSILNQSSFSKLSGKTIEQINDEELPVILDLLSSSFTINKIRAAIFNTGDILIHFPHVVVYNENDRFTEINNLYAKVEINVYGKLIRTFKLNRSDYSYIHLLNNYLHSHISGIPFDNFEYFKEPCLGTGPIRDTIVSLNVSYDKELWKLFCLELNKYIATESISGGPYHRLEELSTNKKIRSIDCYSVVNINPITNEDINNCFKEFINYFINHNNLTYKFIADSYSIGMSITDYILTLSNSFIEWYNNNKYNYTTEDLIAYKVLDKCDIIGNKIYINNVYTKVTKYEKYIGKKVCTFKGKDVLLTIEDLNAIKEEPCSLIINPNLCLYVAYKIVKVINYKYGKPSSILSKGITGKEIIKYL